MVKEINRRPDTDAGVATTENPKKTKRPAKKAAKKVAAKKATRPSGWVVTNPDKYPSGQSLAYDMFQKAGKDWKDKVTFEAMSKEMLKYFPKSTFNKDRFSWLRSSYNSGKAIARAGSAKIAPKLIKK